jgi:hypothetical protein
MPQDNNDAFKKLKHRLIKLLDPDWVDKSEHQSKDEVDEASEFKINETLSNKVKGIINDFIEAAPLIEAAGFRIRDLEVELSVIPKLIPHFEKMADTDDATRNEIIAKVGNKRIIRLLLKALFKADNFQKSLKMGNLQFSGIEIEITAIPAIRLIYKNPNKSIKWNHLLE